MTIKNYTALWVSGLVLILYYVGYFAFGGDSAKIVVGSLVVGCALANFLTWLKSALLALASGVRSGTENILVSTWLVWTVILLFFVYADAFLVAGRPPEWTASPVSGTLYTLFFLAGVYAVLTPINDRRSAIEKVSMVSWFVCVGAGGLAAGVLMTLAFLRIFVAPF